MTGRGEGVTAEDDFRDFVVARSVALRRTAYLLTGDHQHAEDLLQTTLAKVYLAWDRIRDPRAVEAYARRTLTTTYTSWWRRRSWQERLSGDLPERQVADGTGGLDDRTDLWRVLQMLPRQQRAVVVLRFYEDLSVAETAGALGIGSGSVKSHTSRALAALRVRTDDDAAAAARTELER